ncbi:MAG: protein-L-isoaspartate(D-aspartate) O-methyltransferase [Planctomycetota bacterium]
MNQEDNKYAAERERMVQRHLRERGIRNARVLEAFRQVPRERFVPPEHADEAYADHPVPIGYGQTISQPYIVALMIEQLDPQPSEKVLDVGAGSGYQTAILAHLCRHVYALERLTELTEQAVLALGALNVTNVSVCTGDGTLGWPEEAPFDGVICGAAAPEIPDAWAQQLADGGRIVVPVGGSGAQSLLRLTKRGDELHREHICDVRFVKLIGKSGWPEN